MAKGHNHKKMKAQRKAKRKRMDRQYNLRSTASHIDTSKFLACNELILYHMMDVCTLSTLIALSHTSQLFRELVKTLYRIRLVAMIRLFVGHDNIKTFFDVLEATESAIAGSTLAYVLAPPIDDVEEWVPSNLNIYTPLGQVGPWEEFFARLQFPTCTHQPGISRAYKTSIAVMSIKKGLDGWHGKMGKHPEMAGRNSGRRVEGRMTVINKRDARVTLLTRCRPPKGKRDSIACVTVKVHQTL
ncbi:hypothetical protein B0H10DRAFT_2436949 [Mycena sp. CBHHK59/15]|nr:hypothetical protein B0H10DRAFT_2436949 [Mycena sp. CBHHK59/15]